MLKPFWLFRPTTPKQLVGRIIIAFGIGVGTWAVLRVVEQHLDAQLNEDFAELFKELEAIDAEAQ